MLSAIRATRRRERAPVRFPRGATTKPVIAIEPARIVNARTPALVLLLVLLLAMLTSPVSSALAAANACTAASGAAVPAVVELYTSEGCDSCPPADRWVSSLKADAAKGKVIPLAFHVDYWDYIGWKDRFA